MKRLFGCTGTIQLITACLAGKTCSGAPQAGSKTRDYLLCYDLGCPPSQADDFASVLLEMAGHLGPWEKVTYITDAELQDIYTQFGKRGFGAIQPILKTYMGADAVDELYLGQNRSLFNSLLLNSFPTAFKVCYGDAIGVNFSANYLDGAPPAVSKMLRLLEGGRQSLRSLKRTILGTNLSAVPFDKYCLLAPNFFDEPLANFVVPEIADCRELFSRCALLDDRAQQLKAVKDGLAEATGMLLVLTADWSSRDHLSQNNEVAACAEFVETLACGADTLVVIKPHPRELLDKTRQLQRLLKRSFENVIVLSDPSLSYQPVESIYAACLGPAAKGLPVRVAAFSSAGLALELLYNQRCHLGFGSELVQKYFHPPHVERRLVQEKDLEQAVRVIRGLVEKS